MTVNINHPVLLDKMENQIAVLQLTYNLKITQRLQQDYTIEFYHPLDDAGKWQLITTECLVNVNGDLYVLKVVEPDDSGGNGLVIHCQGDHVMTQATDEFIDPADDATLGRTSVLYGVTAQTALQNALMGTRFTVGDVTITGWETTSTADAAQGANTITIADVSQAQKNQLIQIGSGEATITNISGNTLTIDPPLFEEAPSGTPVGVGIHDIDMTERTLMDVLREMETTWGGEMEWSNRTINFLTQMGQENGVVLRYRKNNKSIKRTEDSRALCTRLYGYGNGGITIESIYPTKYIDASTIGNYPHPIKVKKDYSNIDDPETLLQAMQTDLNAMSAPQVTYELEVVELSRVAGYPYPSFEKFSLGDYVTVIDERLNDMSVVARIVEYEWYPYEPQLSRVQINSLIQTTYDRQLDVHSHVTNLLQTVNISPRRNGRPIGTVANPASPTPSITYTQNTDGSVNLIVAWAFTEDATSPIDGFGVLVHADTASTKYTFPSGVISDASGMVDKTTQAFELNGVPADKYYTVAVYPYRAVDADIDTSMQIRGGFWYANGGTSYQPASSVVFTGSVKDKFGNVTVDQNGLNLLNTNGFGVQSGLLLSYSNFSPPTAANNYAGMTVTETTSTCVMGYLAGYSSSTVVNVQSTAGFPSSGSFYLANPPYAPLKVTYTALTATSFTGCNLWDTSAGSGDRGTPNNYTIPIGSRVFLWYRPTATLNVSSGVSVNQSNVTYNVSAGSFANEDVAADGMDQDGWEFRYVYVDANGTLKVASAGTSDGFKVYPPAPPSGSVALGWFVVGYGTVLPSGSINTSAGKAYDANGMPIWSIVTKMDIAYRNVRPIATNTSTNTALTNALNTGIQQNSITVNAGQTYVMYIPIGNNVKTSCRLNITPNTTVNGADTSRAGASMTVASQPNGSNAGNRPIWGTYVDSTGAATNIDQQQNNATYGNYMIPPGILGVSSTVIQDLDIVPDPSTPSQADLKVVFYNSSTTTNETLNLRFNWHAS